MSGFLLDTNVPSELIRTRPELRVGSWVYAQDEQLLFLSVVSIGELSKGLTLLPAGPRRTELERWFHQDLVPPVSGSHCTGDAPCRLPMGRSRWRAPTAWNPAQHGGRQIAATALEHDLVIATRNVEDFVGLGVTLLNPWDTK